MVVVEVVMIMMMILKIEILIKQCREIYIVL